MMKQPKPRRIAYCWLYGIELTHADIKKKKCTDPNKQSQHLDQVCKHLQLYGDLENERRWRNMRAEKVKKEKQLTMQELYNTIATTLEEHGVRLEGSRLCLVQDIPNGGKMRLWFDDAEKYREGAFL